MTVGVNIYKAQRDEYEQKLGLQLKEQAAIQASIAELVGVSSKIKAQYEEEIMRLRRELDSALRGNAPNPAQPSLPTSNGSVTAPPAKRWKGETDDWQVQKATSLPLRLSLIHTLPHTR